MAKSKKRSKPHGDSASRKGTGQSEGKKVKDDKVAEQEQAADQAQATDRDQTAEQGQPAKQNHDNVQREFKDRLFKFIFGNPEHKDWTLDLYNALNGSSYTDPEKIIFTTIQEILYIGMRNDVSFILGAHLCLYEQQATVNPNLPLRFFLYLARLYEKYASTTPGFDLRSRTLKTYPTPKCICFYNGPDKKGIPDETELYLSAGFQGGMGDTDLCVHVYNINPGKIKDMLKASRPLCEYSTFVNDVRDILAELKEENQKTDTENLREAIDKALDGMPDDFVIKEFLIQNRAEVIGMCLTEYNEEKTLQVLFDDGVQQGAELKARAIARKNALAGKSIDDIADFLGESVETVTQWLVEEGILTPANA